MKVSEFEIQMLLRRTGHGANCFRSGDLTRVRLLACQSGPRHQALRLTRQRHRPELVGGAIGVPLSTEADLAGGEHRA